MQLFLTFKSKYNRKSFFTKMLLIYFVFTFVVVLSSSYVLTGYLNKTLEKEIYKSNTHLLNQVKIFADTYLLEKVYSIVTEKFLDISKDENISDFYSSNNRDNAGTLYRVYNNIENTKVNNNFIDTISIYRKSDDTLVSSREGICFNVSSPASNVKDSIDTGLIKQIMSSSESQKWISPQENNVTIKSKPVISFTQAIPMLSSMDERLGCVIINIDADVFFKSLSNIPSANNIGDLLIIDSKGNLFANSNLGSFAEGLEDDGFQTLKIKEELVGVSWVKSTMNDWKYISIVPINMLNRQLFVTKQFAFLVIGIVLVFSFCCLNIITSRLYKPLNTLIKSTRDKFGTTRDNLDIQHTSDEITYINGIILNLSKRVEEMENTLYDNRRLIEYGIAMDILNGNIVDKDEIKKTLEIADISFKYKYCLIMLTEIKNQLFLKLPLEQRKFVTYKMIELINKSFKNKCTCISVCHPSNCIITICNFDDYDTVYSSATTTLKLLEKDFNLSYNIAISEPVLDLLVLDRIYDSAAGYLKYGFIYGYGNIFTHDMINKFESNNNKSDNINNNITRPVVPDNLDSLLRSCKIESLKDEIVKVIQSIKNPEYSYNYVQSVLLQIISSVCRVSYEQNIICDELNKNTLLIEFNNIESIDECQQWLLSLIDLYGQSVNTRNASIDDEMISKIIQYICNNINNQISLNTVSDYFNISPSHLSKIFKVATGINFSDFVINKKFEKATMLLLSCRQMSVTEIAEALGYFNPSYFTKLFKEKFGMTPVQLRKKNSVI